MTTATEDMRAAFVRSIVEEPHRDDLRLIFADWLEDENNKACNLRAAYIRNQIATGEQEVCASDDEWIEEEVFRRGFLDEIRCALQQWLDHGPQIVLKHPVTRVRLTDREPEDSDDYKGMVFWGSMSNGYELAECQPFHLTSNIFAFLTGSLMPVGCYNPLAYYHTRELAMDDLSIGAVRWARAKAELPPLGKE